MSEKNYPAWCIQIYPTPLGAIRVSVTGELDEQGKNWLAYFEAANRDEELPEPDPLQRSK